MPLDFGPVPINRHEKGKGAAWPQTQVGESHRGLHDIRCRGTCRGRCQGVPGAVGSLLVDFHRGTQVRPRHYDASVRGIGERHAAPQAVRQFLGGRTAEVETEVQVFEVEPKHERT